MAIDPPDPDELHALDALQDLQDELLQLNARIEAAMRRRDVVAARISKWKRFLNEELKVDSAGAATEGSDPVTEPGPETASIESHGVRQLTQQRIDATLRLMDETGGPASVASIIEYLATSGDSVDRNTVHYMLRAGPFERRGRGIYGPMRAREPGVNSSVRRKFEDD